MLLCRPALACAGPCLPAALPAGLPARGAASGARGLGEAGAAAAAGPACVSLLAAAAPVAAMPLCCEFAVSRGPAGAAAEAAFGGSAPAAPPHAGWDEGCEAGAPAPAPPPLALSPAPAPADSHVRSVFWVPAQQGQARLGSPACWPHRFRGVRQGDDGLTGVQSTPFRCPALLAHKQTSERPPYHRQCSK
jgi:hypothetical protein